MEQIPNISGNVDQTLKEFDEKQKQLEQSKSTKRLFWLFVCLDIGVLAWVIFTVIKIFMAVLSA